MKLYKNAEDGVQFGNSSGNGNVISNNAIYNNLADGIYINQGSQRLSGNKISGNDTNAVLIHNGSETITLTVPQLQHVDKANALDDGRRSEERTTGKEGVG